ncbi:Hypothetical predicted protein [Octopus vulgaris]|uniref:Uncharacterized protein n=1 Tax=Octopus vulgaris TaxID=6645 RepID=A0AA36AUI3_OCTVU|nr:Hypothetical predicted protein [Octopus vulgaris]
MNRNLSDSVRCEFVELNPDKDNNLHRLKSCRLLVITKNGERELWISDSVEVLADDVNVKNVAILKQHRMVLNSCLVYQRKFPTTKMFMANFSLKT